MQIWQFQVEEELEELLDAAVKRQMISDVSIGVFLSGGIDSSLIAALMARHSEKPIRTFSIAFDNAAMDESPIAQLVARQFGTDHTVLRAEELGPEELLELIGRLDEPFADAAVVPTYALSKMTAGHVKVALSGDGGDEVFGGYPKYFLGRLNGQGFPLRVVVASIFAGFAMEASRHVSYLSADPLFSRTSSMVIHDVRRLPHI